MVLAVRGCADLRLHLVRDERAAAFFALGHVRASGQACALLCTSGTAAGHYLPAVMEAKASGLPLLVISADRPPELQDIAAPQTVDQTRLFGTHCVAYVDLGMPDEHPAALRGLQRRAAQALHRCKYPEAGAVQLDLRARKPLEPPADDSAAKALTQHVQALIQVGPAQAYGSRPIASSEGLDALRSALSGARRPLFVVGPQGVQAGFAETVFELARQIGAVVIAEAASQLRLGRVPQGVCRPTGYDRILGLPDAVTALAPDLVLQIGGPATSARLLRALATWEAPRWIAADSGWPDMDNRAQGLVLGEVQDTLTRLGGIDAQTSAYAEQWSQADDLAWSTADVGWGEGLVAKTTLEHLPKDAGLMLGNSLSIRHVETYAVSTGSPAVVVQRGVNGIDGLVAGACGWITQSQRPMALLLGDVSLLHDASSLELARGLPAPLVIVVVDNQGGRIFESLGIQDRVPEAMEFFVTPPEVDIQALGAAYGAQCHHVQDAPALRTALELGFGTKGATLVQASVSPSGARSQLQALLTELELLWRGTDHV